MIKNILCLLGLHKYEGRYHSIWKQCGGGCYGHVCERCGITKYCEKCDTPEKYCYSDLPCSKCALYKASIIYGKKRRICGRGLVKEAHETKET